MIIYIEINSHMRVLSISSGCHLCNRHTGELHLRYFSWGGGLCKQIFVGLYRVIIMLEEVGKVVHVFHNNILDTTTATCFW